MTDALLSRFLRYVKINTQSDPESTTYPSTPNQMEFQKALQAELEQMSLQDVKLDEYGYLTATIPATVSTEEAQRTPVIGFIAHIDTSSDVSGDGVRPQIVEYSGGDIVITDNVIIAAQSLRQYIGHKIIVADGTTLLGADDKAGVAEIVSAAKYLIDHPEIKHGKIRIAFTPDEEIGRGTEYFNVEKFGAKYAYTVDGGLVGSIEYETFNAAKAVIHINGISSHPGYAKGRMINAQRIALELDQMLPATERPENTIGREGFFHLTKIQGEVESATMHYIIRDHSREFFEQRKAKLQSAAEALASKYPTAKIEINICDQYYNMRERVAPTMDVVEIALHAMRDSGITPIVDIVRGGTDGSSLSFRGLPCPNIFSGAENIHSRKEFVSLDVMLLSVNTIINICRIFYTNPLEY